MQKNRCNTVADLANAPFARRVAAFLLTFAVAAGAFDLQTIHAGLANRYGFGVYGEAGKAISIGIIAFTLLAIRGKKRSVLLLWRLNDLFWLVGSAATVSIGWYAISRFSIDRAQTVWLLVAHASIILTLVFLLFFAFGMRNLYLIARRTYARELLLSLGLSVLFSIFLVGLYALWPYLSTTVLVSVKKLFDVVGIYAAYLPPYTLIFSKFSVTVGEYCSGIDSAALFTALYALIGVLDWPRLNHKRYLFIFTPALLVLFGLNILRVFLLILAGFYINPQIAFSLFHTYAGMLFFILYAAIFWSVSYKWVSHIGNPQSSK